MGTEGFSGNIPENWNKLWVWWWLLGSPAIVVSAFLLPFWAWIPTAVLGFLTPEIVSVVKKDDSLPPLTHTIRHFLPNWLAFPLIYGSLGSVGANWLDYPRPLAIGALFGLLGWLTDHFSVTYAGPDPFPYSHRELLHGTQRRRLPA